MKPDLPPVSPRKFHPSLTETPLESRLNLPDGRMAGEISTDPQELAEYCQSYFGETWATLRHAALHDLSTRLDAIRSRIPVFEDLLRKGQPAISLRGVYDEMYQSLSALYAKGSLNALLVIAELRLICDRFPPLRNSGKRVDALRIAEDDGNIAVYAFLGDHFLKQGFAEVAAVAYRQGSEMGCSACAYQLGQFAERGVGGLPKSDEMAYAHYQRAAREKYPPANVALAKLWLSNADTLCQPVNLVESLVNSMELGCEGAAGLLDQAFMRLGRVPVTQQKVLSLLRCAAVAGDVEAQLKLASALVGRDPDVDATWADAQEAEQWYLSICSAEYPTSEQKARAQLQLAHLYMGQGRDVQAALYFLYASDAYPEAAELKAECERRLNFVVR